MACRRLRPGRAAGWAVRPTRGPCGGAARLVVVAPLQVHAGLGLLGDAGADRDVGGELDLDLGLAGAPVQALLGLHVDVVREVLAGAGAGLAGRRPALDAQRVEAGGAPDCAPDAVDAAPALELAH